MRALVLTLLLYSGLALGGTYTAPRDMIPETMAQWNRLIYQVSHDPDNVITIYWNGNGGHDVDANKILAQLLPYRTKIVLIVTSRAASNHANLLCYFKFVNRGVLRYHATYTRNEAGKKIRLYYDTQYQTRECVRRGILTQNDIRILVEQSMLLKIYSNGNRQFVRERD